MVETQCHGTSTTTATKGNVYLNTRVHAKFTNLKHVKNEWLSTAKSQSVINSEILFLSTKFPMRIQIETIFTFALYLFVRSFGVSARNSNYCPYLWLFFQIVNRLAFTAFTHSDWRYQCTFAQNIPSNLQHESNRNQNNL